jgi:RHS repeat-associated protein
LVAIEAPPASATIGEPLYYTSDHRYSVQAITDGNGTVVERYAYTPYGEMAVLDAAGAPKALQEPLQPYGHTGRRHDQETGLQYFRARYFDAELGRFISRDPLRYVSGPNLYAGYFIPHFTDPSGLCPDCQYGECKVDNFSYYFTDEEYELHEPDLTGYLKRKRPKVTTLTFTYHWEVEDVDVTITWDRYDCDDCCDRVCYILWCRHYTWSDADAQEEDFSLGGYVSDFVLPPTKAEERAGLQAKIDAALNNIKRATRARVRKKMKEIQKREEAKCKQ